MLLYLMENIDAFYNGTNLYLKKKLLKFYTKVCFNSYQNIDAKLAENLSCKQNWKWLTKTSYHYTAKTGCLICHK